MSTIALEACPSCGGTGFEPSPVGSNPLRRCTACGLVSAPECADPDTIYTEGYLTGATDFGPPNVLHPDFQRFLVYAGHVRMAIAERVVGTGGSLLDVGCGTGDVMVAAAERGWRTVGVEPVAESADAAVARGLDVRCALLQESGLPEGSFDLVTAYHVVEHMADSTGFLRLIARWAKPGGHVLVEVPNWGSVHRRAGGDRWIGLRPLEHIGHYDPRTLRATMARAGLEPVEVSTTGFLWEEQTFDQVLADLGLSRATRLLAPLSRPTLVGDREVAVPRPLGWRALRALQRAYDAAKVGQVVYAIGRVPG